MSMLPTSPLTESQTAGLLSSATHTPLPSRSLSALVVPLIVEGGTYIAKGLSDIARFTVTLGAGAAPVIAQTGLIFSTVFGFGINTFVEVGNGIVDYRNASQIHDHEGQRTAGSKIANGAASAGAWALTGVQTAAPAAPVIIGTLATVFFGIGLAVGIISTSVDIKRSYTFLSKLDGEEGVDYLQSLRDLNPTDKEVVLQYLKRRTNGNIAKKILGIEEDKEPVKIDKQFALEVKAAALTTIKFKIAVLAVYLLATVALVLGTFFAMVALSHILFAAAAIILIGIYLYSIFS